MRPLPYLTLHSDLLRGLVLSPVETNKAERLLCIEAEERDRPSNSPGVKCPFLPWNSAGKQKRLR